MTKDSKSAQDPGCGERDMDDFRNLVSDQVASANAWNPGGRSQVSRVIRGESCLDTGLVRAWRLRLSGDVVVGLVPDAI